MDILRGMNKKRLDKWLESMNDQEFEEWLESVGLLHSQRACPGMNGVPCGQMMSKTARKGVKLWRCGARGCRKELGYKSGTFFENQNLSFRLVSLSRT